MNTMLGWWSGLQLRPDGLGVVTSPTTLVSFEALKPSAMAKPPPINSSTPHGRCSCATSHVRMAWPGVRHEGMRKSSTAVKQAVLASFKAGKAT